MKKIILFLIFCLFSKAHASTSINVFQILMTSPSAHANVPVGAVFAMLGDTCPKDYINLNVEHTLSRDDFPKLFQQAKTVHGGGDGSTTFNTPNLAGIGIRGAGSQSFGGKTYNAPLNEKRIDALASHQHVYPGYDYDFQPRDQSTPQGYSPRPEGANWTTRNLTAPAGSGTETHGPDIALYCFDYLC